MNERFDEETIKKKKKNKVIDKEELKKEIDEILSTDDVEERIKIWQKYHPNEVMHLEDVQKPNTDDKNL